MPADATFPYRSLDKILRRQDRLLQKIFVAVV
jgi:hypothetical protein